jgi:hypothetical protein
MVLVVCAVLLIAAASCDTAQAVPQSDIDMVG